MTEKTSYTSYAAFFQRAKKASNGKKGEAMDQGKDYNIAYAELVNRCWEDPAYLAKFKEDPAAALEEFGIPTVPGATYHIVAPNDVKPNTETDIYLPYQDKPGLQTLEDDMLDGAAGGGFVWKHSNIIANANAVAQENAVGYSEAAAVTIATAVTVG
jgi:hypothetical protein